MSTGMVSRAMAGSSKSTPLAQCVIQCLKLRNRKVDTPGCNGFALFEEEEKCMVGYADPNWILDQLVVDPSDEAEIYFDSAYSVP